VRAQRVHRAAVDAEDEILLVAVPFTVMTRPLGSVIVFEPPPAVCPLDATWPSSVVPLGRRTGPLAVLALLLCDERNEEPPLEDELFEDVPKKNPPALEDDLVADVPKYEPRLDELDDVTCATVAADEELETSVWPSGPHCGFMPTCSSQDRWSMIVPSGVTTMLPPVVDEALPP
jgi:hypothetical protein